jgi:S-methylmethionine-dependent homocysteine/selenocysteine methylase
VKQDRVSLFAQAGLDLILLFYLPLPTEITGIYHYTQLFFLMRWDLANFVVPVVLKP